ncbi:hypothetical protein F1D05_03700 [Kribbella qitaiheensis]|uniref:Uncharacterized protein n=2 Tax=Kribbella qitaiheensis TaxID=1544730 RepID=A0A7G6WT65_9ACTN|nr:hypothetical protein F1D05_03700 [Kribbella qitaiheensis]
MLDRGTGAILIPGGLSGKYPIPMLGKLAPASAALRMYVLTLHEALKDQGLRRNAHHRRPDPARRHPHRGARPLEKLGAEAAADLDPDQIADTAWEMYLGRTVPESEFSTRPVPA